MMENIYKKGRRKEYAICDELKQFGYTIVQRTAKSHGAFDIVAVHKSTRKILFIQSKRKLSESMDHVDLNEKSRIEDEMSWLNGNFNVEFQVL